MHNASNAQLRLCAGCLVPLLFHSTCAAACGLECRRMARLVAVSSAPLRPQAAFACEIERHPSDFKKIRTKSLRTSRMWASSHALLKLAFRGFKQPEAAAATSGGPHTTHHSNWRNKTGAARREEADPRVLQLNDQADIRARRRLHFRREIAAMIQGSEHFVIRTATIKTHERGASKQEVNRVELNCRGEQVNLNVHNASELGLDTTLFPGKVDPPTHHGDIRCNLST